MQEISTKYLNFWYYGNELDLSLKHFFEYIRKQAYFIEIHKLSNLKKVNFREFRYLKTFEYRISPECEHQMAS